MNKVIIGIIIIVVLIILGIIIFTGGDKQQPTVDPLEESKEVARVWIVNNAQTYVFDGSDLSFVGGEVVDEQTYKLTFSFESSAAGYGDRSDEMSAQVITPHLIEVLVRNGQVVSAITDSVYDEIKEEMIQEEDVSPETLIISLYFVKTIDGQEELAEVLREIPYTLSVGRASIEELLKGPSLAEQAEGFSTAIPEGVELLSIDIQDGVATVDFNESLQEGVAGSAWVTTIRDQIERTLTQFDTVAQVTISIEGEIDEILQP